MGRHGASCAEVRVGFPEEVPSCNGVLLISVDHHQVPNFLHHVQESENVFVNGTETDHEKIMALRKKLLGKILVVWWAGRFALAFQWNGESRIVEIAANESVTIAMASEDRHILTRRAWKRGVKAKPLELARATARRRTASC